MATGTYCCPTRRSSELGGTATSTLTIATNGSTATGTFTIALRGVSGGLTRETPVTLTINAGADFSVTASPTSRTITRGATATYNLTVQSLNRFTEPVGI